jgi:hypothetical protein
MAILNDGGVNNKLIFYKGLFGNIYWEKKECGEER